MSGWSMAINNLHPAPAAPAPATPGAAPTSPARKKVSPAFCPHCGKRMRSPDGPKPWTDEEDTLLRARVAAETKHEAIASEIGRALSSIKSRINTLKLNGGRRNGK